MHRKSWLKKKRGVSIFLLYKKENWVSEELSNWRKVTTAQNDQLKHMTLNPVLFPTANKDWFFLASLYMKRIGWEKGPWPSICASYNLWDLVIPIQGAQRAPAGAEPLNPPCNHHSGLCWFNFPGAATPAGSPPLSSQWLPPLSCSGTAPCQSTVGPSARSIHSTPCRYCNLETGQFIPLPAG